VTAAAPTVADAAAPERTRTLTVLHSTWIWLPLTETWLANQLRFLPASIESHVVCERSVDTGRFRPASVRAAADAGAIRHVADRAARKAYRRYPRILARRTRELRPDVLHSHFGHIGWRDARWTDRARVPHVVSFYGADASSIPRSDARWRGRYEELFESANAILCEGPAMADAIHALGCPRVKVRVHSLGIDLDRIPFRPRQLAPGEPLRVMLAASFREKKGIPVALRALAFARRLGLDLEATLIGGANTVAERREAERIHAALADPALTGRIRVLGFQPYGKLLAEAYDHHVFMSPSQVGTDGDTEGGAPLAILEAAASGMPVSSTTHCDIPNVLGEPNRRLLVAEGDVEGLARALVTLRELDWLELTSANRRRAETCFDARLQGERLAAIYRSFA
jgi:colanic acid/amylovoran/stewartan biosynthesis glycosyltransferase WcaL/AmsK/CpsK